MKIFFQNTDPSSKIGMLFILKPGEQFKIQLTADAIIEQLIEFQADRSTILIGVGGGVVTDLTGYVASIYMRGIHMWICAYNVACHG